MEVFGIIVLASMVILNASAFFSAADHQKRLYEKTAADTKFNKSANSSL